MSLQVKCQSTSVVQFSLCCSVQHRLVVGCIHGHWNCAEFNTERILLILTSNSLLGKSLSDIINWKSSSLGNDTYVLSVEGYTLIRMFWTLQKLGEVWECFKSQGLQCPNSDKHTLGIPTVSMVLNQSFFLGKRSLLYFPLLNPYYKKSLIFFYIGTVLSKPYTWKSLSQLFRLWILAQTYGIIFKVSGKGKHVDTV